MGKVGWIAGGLVLLPYITVNVPHALAQQSAGEGQPSASRFETRPLSTAVQVGLASPGGLAGIEVEYGLSRWLAVGTGGGPTLLGWQAGAWLAPRWPFTTVALGLDLGPSIGPYREISVMDEHGPWMHVKLARWFNSAARLQYVAQDGFSFRAFLGVTTLLNRGDGSCGSGNETRPCSRRSLAYGGLAFGYAFWLGARRGSR